RKRIARFRQRRRAGRGPPPQSCPRSFCGRGRVCGWQHQGPPQRRVCRQRALPHAGGQFDGRLANGPRLAGGPHTRGASPRRRLHGRQGDHRAFLRRPHPVQGPRHPRQHRGRCWQRDRDGARSFLKLIPTKILRRPHVQIAPRSGEPALSRDCLA
ncbi:Uncharacterized protein APZ42_003105, partial [Daphnia magna]